MKLRTALFVPFLATAVQAQVVHTVDDDGPADFSSLSAAVAAASAGDLVLVSSGDYLGFSLSKPLTIAADSGAQVTVRSGIQVGGLEGDESVALLGIDVELDNTVLAPGVVIGESEGHVQIDNCHLKAHWGPALLAISR